MKNIMFLILLFSSFGLFANDVDPTIRVAPKKLNLKICQEDNCLDHLSIKGEKDFHNFDCSGCEENRFKSENRFEPFHDFRLAREVGEIAQVALLTEMLAKTQSAEDKKNHVRAGAYIGYFSKKACQYGPELLNLDFEIGPAGQFLCAVAGATAAGLLKEAYDSRHPDKHTVDAKDALATSLGAVVTIPLLYIEF